MFLQTDKEIGKKFLFNYWKHWLWKRMTWKFENLTFLSFLSSNNPGSNLTAGSSSTSIRKISESRKSIATSTRSNSTLSSKSNNLDPTIAHGKQFTCTYFLHHKNAIKFLWKTLYSSWFRNPVLCEIYLFFMRK